MAWSTLESQVSCRDGSGGDDTSEDRSTGWQRSLNCDNTNVWRLDYRGRQREKQCVGGIQAGRQLSVLCNELGIAQRCNSVSRSVPLCPQALQHCINRAELALQRYAFGSLGRLYSRLELIAVS